MAILWLVLLDSQFLIMIFVILYPWYIYAMKNGERALIIKWKILWYVKLTNKHPLKLDLYKRMESRTLALGWLLVGSLCNVEKRQLVECVWLERRMTQNLCDAKFNRETIWIVSFVTQLFYVFWLSDSLETLQPVISLYWWCL